MHRTTLLLFLAVLIAGCGTSTSEERPGAPPGGVEPSLFREGKAVFMRRCTVCHGERANGKGTMAQTIPPPKPANFRRKVYQTMPTDSLRQIIVKGGKALGRNPRMPAWGEELTKGEIEAVIVFIRTVGRFGKIPNDEQVRKSSWFRN